MPANCSLRILTYHRIADREAIKPYDPQLVSATPAEFEKQVAWMAHNYSVVGVDDLFDAIDGGKRLPKNAVLLTFDDAYPDFKTTAWPILKSYGLPAALFVPTNFPDRPNMVFWWDKLCAGILLTKSNHVSADPLGQLSLETEEDKRATSQALRTQFKLFPHAEAMAWIDDICKQLLPEGVDLSSTMSWDDIKTLADDGVTIGAHSRSHPLLTQIPVEDLHDEISGSYRDLQERLSNVLPIFCYPGGAHNEAVMSIAAQCGIRIAFATLMGHNRLDRTNLLQLRRINMTPRTDLKILRVKLSSIGIKFNLMRKKLFS